MTHKIFHEWRASCNRSLFLSLFSLFIYFFFLTIRFPTIFLLVNCAAAKLKWLWNVIGNTYGSRNFADQVRLNDAGHSRQQRRGGVSKWPSYSRTLNRRREHSFVWKLCKIRQRRIFERFIDEFNKSFRIPRMLDIKKFPSYSVNFIYLVKFVIIMN